MLDMRTRNRLRPHMEAPNVLHLRPPTVPSIRRGDPWRGTTSTPKLQQSARKPARDTNGHATADNAGMVAGPEGCRAGRENFPAARPPQGSTGAGTPSPIPAPLPLHRPASLPEPLTWSNIGMRSAVFIHRAGQGLFYRHASCMLGACPSSVLCVSPGFLLLRLIGRGFVRVRVSRRRIGSGRGVAFLRR